VNVLGEPTSVGPSSLQSPGERQVDLAKKAKVGRTYIVKLESGDNKNFSLAVLQRLAKALGVPVVELLG